MIVMNTDYWYAPSTSKIPLFSGGVHGYIMDGQLAWLKNTIGKLEENSAKRVVQGQRSTQAASDIFLGWHQEVHSGTHYYWRQLKDMKGSLDVADLDKNGLETYLQVCGICLARAHARTGDSASISGYIGNGKALASGITEFAVAYADQAERDHQALVEAIESGRVIAEEGI